MERWAIAEKAALSQDGYGITLHAPENVDFKMWAPQATSPYQATAHKVALIAIPFMCRFTPPTTRPFHIQCVRAKPTTSSDRTSRMRAPIATPFTRRTVATVSSP